MLIALFLAFGVLGTPRGEQAAPDVAQRVARVLVRQVDPDPGAVAAGAAEILAIGSVSEVLFEALGSGRAPAGEDGEGARLERGQKAILAAAIQGLGPGVRARFAADVAREPGSAARVAAALRVLGLAREPDAAAMLALARTAEARGLGAGVEEALEESLQAALARKAAGVGAVSAAWKDLGPITASVSVQVLDHARTRDALACLRGLLGRRAELDACLLIAIGNSLEHLEPREIDAMRADFERYLDAPDTAKAQAAAAGLGRLGAPASVPALIRHLGDADAALARTTLAALQSLGAASLPPTPSLWRSWYAHEQAWWVESAPALLEALKDCVEGDCDRGQLVELARELTEHPLHRDDLVPAFVTLLEDDDVDACVVACDALQRLDSRRAIVPLCARLEDSRRGVVAASRTALASLLRIPMPANRDAWRAVVRGLDLAGLEN